MKFSHMLTKRLKGEKENEKMRALAERSGSGQLSSFSGVFQVTNVSAKEESMLQLILEKHAQEGQDTQEDLRRLLQITSEVKAISDQSAMLHGERIKQAQTVLREYSEGAFSAWLVETYGNRQTPYNFLVYYEFYNSINEPLKAIVDEMPKQVIYTLSTRQMTQQDKEEFVERYNGETKDELLSMLRKHFPLAKTDRRCNNKVRNTLSSMRRLVRDLNTSEFVPTSSQKGELRLLMDQIERLLDEG